MTTRYLGENRHGLAIRMRRIIAAAIAAVVLSLSASTAVQWTVYCPSSVHFTC